MEVNEREILRLVSEINNIKSTKLSEWSSKTKKYLPAYVAEYLFQKNIGVVHQMLTSETENGLMYDPMILRQGIDMLMLILEGQNYGKDSGVLALKYKNFADAPTRIGYLKQIIDQIDIYPTIGDAVVADVEVLKQSTQNPEDLELLESYVRSVQSRKIMQEAELKERLARQKQ